MTVQELISLLSLQQDKSIPIYLFNGEILELKEDMIDLSITDRIDINIPSDF